MNSFFNRTIVRHLGGRGRLHFAQWCFRKLFSHLFLIKGLNTGYPRITFFLKKKVISQCRPSTKENVGLAVPNVFLSRRNVIRPSSRIADRVTLVSSVWTQIMNPFCGVSQTVGVVITINRNEYAENPGGLGGSRVCEVQGLCGAISYLKKSLLYPLVGQTL